MALLKEVKYGYVEGYRVFVHSLPLSASIVFTDTGGKFVRVDSSNRLEIADSGDTDILGWVEVGAHTGSATAGQDNLGVDISPMSLYKMPADATTADTIVGDTCDLIVTSNVQYADIGESSEDIIRVLAHDATDNIVLVHLWTPNLTATGVA